MKDSSDGEIRVPSQLLGGMRAALLEEWTEGAFNLEQIELAKSLIALIDAAPARALADPGALSVAGEDGVRLVDDALVLPATSASSSLARVALVGARSRTLPFEVPIRLRLREAQLDELQELLAGTVR